MVGGLHVRRDVSLVCSDGAGDVFAGQRPAQGDS